MAVGGRLDLGHPGHVASDGRVEDDACEAVVYVNGPIWLDTKHVSQRLCVMALA